MSFNAGDTYNFILNIPTVSGTPTITSPPIITIIDISNPGSPVVSGASMVFITGTSFIYRYSFTIPAASPKDYIAIYSYALSNSQSLGTATAASWSGGVISYTFGLPLPINAVPGSKLTTAGFTPSGYNVTTQTILGVTSAGVITIAGSNPGTSSILGTGSAITNITVSNQLISSSSILHVGDSYITGPVALDATVAQNSTVAKDSTVFKTTSYVSPTNDTTVQAINSAVTTILANSNTSTTLLGTLSAGTLSGLIQDVYDNLFGSWSIDQTVNPPILYIKRINGTQIASFELVNNNTATQRNVLSNPPESNI
jgi:hypothetical protein